MSNQPTIYRYPSLAKVATRLRDDLNSRDYILLFAHNGTGKTRLSMEFKDRSKKRRRDPVTDTLYFNAFTEDLFHWNNDLEADRDRFLIINHQSQFTAGIPGLALEDRIFAFLERYADFNFRIDATGEVWKVVFYKGTRDNIKVSRGEENIFKWCLFMAIAQLAIDDEEGTGPYNWVKNIYIDDPISSLDDNNAIGVASDLAKLIKKNPGKVKVVISTHHALFYNVMYNELRQQGRASYFLHKKDDKYLLQSTEDTPFFHHVALVSEMKAAADSGNIKTYHFNVLRSILEKTSAYFGFDDFSACLQGVEDEVLFSRALNLLSHGRYSIYQPVEMNDDNKDLFRNILYAFLGKYEFRFPQIFADQPQTAQ
ncbi:MAG: AAA family ATPase [Bacteroidia bacterium]|nr:AAA family ATPase [Bacteroidia bacterium]